MESRGRLRSTASTRPPTASHKPLENRHTAAARRILDQPPEALFTLTEVDVPLPEKARIEPSVNCARCGEPTMATKLVRMDGQEVCRGCLS